MSDQPTAEKIQFNDAAVRRFTERIKPGLDEDMVRADLERMAPLGELTMEPPEWVSKVSEAEWHLLLAGAAFPLEQRNDTAPWTANACVVLGDLPPEERDRRDRARALKTSERDSRRNKPNRKR